MAAPMPLVFVMIVCKVVSAGPEDINSGMTGSRNLAWDMTDSVMHCRRLEVQVTSAAEEHNQEAPPWNLDTCWHTALTLGPQFDAEHPNSHYRFWRVACPVPIHTSKDPSSPIVGWKLPECPYKDGTVECEQDSAI